MPCRCPSQHRLSLVERCPPGPAVCTASRTCSHVYAANRHGTSHRRLLDGSARLPCLYCTSSPVILLSAPNGDGSPALRPRQTHGFCGSCSEGRRSAGWAHRDALWLPTGMACRTVIPPSLSGLAPSRYQRQRLVRTTRPPRFMPCHVGGRIEVCIFAVRMAA